MDRVREYMEVDSLIYLMVEELEGDFKNKNNFCYTCFDENNRVR